MRSTPPPRKPRMRRFRLGLVLVAGVAIAVVVGSAGAANPASATTTTNQQLSVEITLSTANDPVWLGTAVSATAEATLGEGDTANVVYVVDASGSMENPSFNPFDPTVANCDGDGLVGTAMDAACVGLIALNGSLGSAVNVNVGLVAFGSSAKTADMGPAGGAQTFTSPPDVDDSGNAVPDADDVIHSVQTEFGDETAVGGIGVFTNDMTASFPGGTNYDAALTNMNASFATQPPTDINTGFFISDGLPSAFTTGAGSPLQDAIDAGTRILTFGIGGGAPNSCDPGAPLRTIADATGGSCTEVADPSDLSTVLPAQLTNIESLVLEVNGVQVASTSGAEPVSMALTNVSITSALVVGINTIEATATAADGTVVTADTTLGVVDLTLTPANEVNDLSVDSSHTVLATVLGDPSQVAGIPVAFTVGGQNAGTMGTCIPAACATAANGQVSFTYSVPVAPSSIGVDTITAVATIPAGTSTRIVTKEWRDLTPPDAACPPTTNPAGKKVPPANNEDGFFELTATDAVDPDPEIFVHDSASSAVFGPFPSGTKIKLTQAPGATPDIKPGAGVIDWHIKLKGDALLVAVDDSDNESDEVSCLVPPPPK